MKRATPAPTPRACARVLVLACLVACLAGTRRARADVPPPRPDPHCTVAEVSAQQSESECVSCGSSNAIESHLQPNPDGTLNNCSGRMYRLDPNYHKVCQTQPNDWRGAVWTEVWCRRRPATQPRGLLRLGRCSVATLGAAPSRADLATAACALAALLAARRRRLRPVA